MEVPKRLRGAIGTQVDHVEKHVHTICLIARRIWRLCIRFGVQNFYYSKVKTSGGFVFGLRA